MPLATRNQLGADTFDASIGGNWANGDGDFATFAWAAGGVVQPAAASGNDSAIRRTADTYPPDQWSQITVATHSNIDQNWLGVSVRMQAGADESCYIGYAVSHPGGGARYQIYELSSSFGQTLLASTGDADSLPAGSTITLEVEGSTIRMYTAEGGGADTERLSTTDATIAAGRPGALGYAQSTTARCQFTSWAGGDFTGGSSVPTITDAGDESFRVGETGVAITCTNAGATQGNGRVRICPSNDINDVNGVNQTVTAWGNTSVTVNIVRGTLPLNTDLYLFIENDGGLTNVSGYVVQLTPSIAVLALAAGLLD